MLAMTLFGRRMDDMTCGGAPVGAVGCSAPLCLLRVLLAPSVRRTYRQEGQAAGERP